MLWTLLMEKCYTSTPASFKGKKKRRSRQGLHVPKKAYHKNNEISCFSWKFGNADWMTLCLWVFLYCFEQNQNQSPTMIVINNLHQSQQEHYLYHHHLYINSLWLVFFSRTLVIFTKLLYIDFFQITSSSKNTLGISSLF